MIVTDLLGQVVQVPEPKERDPRNFTFGRVRAVYCGADGRLRLAVLLTSGFLVDIEAHAARGKLEG